MYVYVGTKEQWKFSSFQVQNSDRAVAFKRSFEVIKSENFKVFFVILFDDAKIKPFDRELAAGLKFYGRFSRSH